MKFKLRYCDTFFNNKKLYEIYEKFKNMKHTHLKQYTLKYYSFCPDLNFLTIDDDEFIEYL